MSCRTPSLAETASHVRHELPPEMQAFSARTMEIYAAMVLSAWIGTSARVIDALKQRGIFESTRGNCCSCLTTARRAPSWKRCRSPETADSANSLPSISTSSILPNLGARDSYVWYGPIAGSTGRHRVRPAYTKPIPRIMAALRRRCFRAPSGPGRVPWRNRRSLRAIVYLECFKRPCCIDLAGRRTSRRHLARAENRAPLPVCRSAATLSRGPMAHLQCTRRMLRPPAGNPIRIRTRHSPGRLESRLYTHRHPGARPTGSSTTSPKTPARPTILHAANPDRLLQESCWICCACATADETGVLPYATSASSNSMPKLVVR